MRRAPSLFAITISLAFLTQTLSVEPTDKRFEPRLAPASDEAQKAIQHFRMAAGLKANVFGAEPMVAHPVQFCFDEQGRCYVAETYRVQAGVTDNRNHMYWLDDDLASRTVADRVALYKKHLKERFPTYEVAHDRVRLLVDTDGDGVADKSTVFADGFHHAEDGLGSGVLARKGNVYYTCIPTLWLLQDTKGAGKADRREALHTGYGVHVSFYGHDMHGLRFGPDGKLYFSIGDRGLNVKTREGTAISLPDEGAVLRCDPDGSNLELVARGLRNPQHLAFDDYGDLFTGDNNSDSGDAARWVYIVEGSDSGWRIGYQYGTAMSDRGPFNAEKIWHMPHEGQPAYIVPPIAHIANGPSGCCYYPGTGLPERYAGHFFLCDFRGSFGGSGVWSFALKRKGASFELVDKHEFIWGILATDCQFGPDSGFYVSDWVEGWGLTGKGRIYRFTEPQLIQSAQAQEVKRLLAEGFDKRPVAELARLLEHPDQRVRQEAQFALAAKGKAAVDTLVDVARNSNRQLARLHAIWGLTQVKEVGPLVPLLFDRDDEVRAQVAKAIGDVHEGKGLLDLVRLTVDDSPRVRFFVAQSLGKFGKRQAESVLVKMLRANAGDDPYLRHAIAVALARINYQPFLNETAKDPDPRVRLGVLLACRLLESKAIADFLNDTDPRIVLEAARAIHDVPISDAMPQLAALPLKPGQSEFLQHRILNAHFRLGAPEDAAAVAAYAARPEMLEKLRLEALRMLGDWTNPPGRDRIMGLWRPLPTRSPDIAANALRSVLGGVFQGPDKVRQEAAKVAAKLGIKEIGPTLFALVSDKQRPAQVRIEAIKALESLKDDRLSQTMRLALDDGDARVRTEGRRLLVRLHPAEALPALEKALKEGTVIDQQGALAILGTLSGVGADKVLAERLDSLLAGKVPATLQLDVLDAASKRSADGFQRKLDQFDASRSKTDHLAKYRECLQGGDAEAGKRIFYEKAETTCLKCHKINGGGGEVGPDLTKIGGQQQRDYLLEAIVDPNRQIAKGYETVVLALTNGKTVSGVLKAEDDKEVKLMTAEAQLIVIPKKDIEERARGKSAMPEDVVKHLTKSEIRDLLEFLAGLK
jgi:quinoprotein glucose dehydrogenase